MTAALVECRIPACRRPDLLRRALRSLQAQTHRDWRALVLDDSPAEESLAVVREFRDPRISGHLNPHPLGAAANIDAAFAATPLLGGALAFVLEDDNAIAPDFIALGVGRLAQAGTDIVSFNQVCIRLGQDGRETREGLLRPAEREEIWTRERILLHAFVGSSLPNGGYFWRLGVPRLDLQVGPSVVEPQLQECIRQTRVPGPLPLLPEPVSLWSLLPPSQVRRQRVAHRRLAANLNRLSLAVLARLGPRRFAESARRLYSAADFLRAERILAEISLLPPRQPARAWRAPWSALRGWLRQAAYADAIDPALHHLSPALAPAPSA